MTIPTTLTPKHTLEAIDPETMHTLNLGRAKRIYRAAVDAQASDAEGEAWWAEVHAELDEVLAARSTAEAAKVISWWHHDWSMVGDTARAAVQRIRATARAAAH